MREYDRRVCTHALVVSLLPNRTAPFDERMTEWVFTIQYPLVVEIN
jgi:hypothetical protein